jgi:hypothetical protein
MSTLQIVNAATEAGAEAAQGARPVYNKRTGQAMIQTPRGLRVNSLLRKDEWEELDSAVVQAATKRLNGVMHLQERGLTQRLGGIGTLLSQWNTASEMTAATANLSGHSRGDRDRVDMHLAGVPVPVVFKPYSIGARELAASRNLGDALNVVNGAAAGRVVAEKLEDMLFNGDSSLNLNGNTIYGYTTHPNRNSGTAGSGDFSNGGDWGTGTNVVSTVADAIAVANADNSYGPFVLYVATTQYNQAANAFFTDGSGQTPLQRVEMLAGIEAVYPSDWLTAGEMVLVEMDREVVDLAIVPGFFPLNNLEWTTGDGMMNMFKAVAIAVPRIKSRYGGKSGIVHVSGI